VALLDVNALVALAWNSRIHHAAVRRWFVAHHAAGWATCPVTESGFVRVSSNRTTRELPHLPSGLTDNRSTGPRLLDRAAEPLRQPGPSIRG